MSANKYAPSPINAKALFNISDIQSPNPDIVPIIGPKALSIYRYAPPDFGIAVANSDFDNTAGRMVIAAIKKANQTDEPVFTAAMPGMINIPPSIPAIHIAIAADKLSFRSNFFINYYLAAN